MQTLVQLIDEIVRATEPQLPRRTDYRIGSIGAGFIVRDCHLEAYRRLGLNPYAITSLSRAECEAVAAQHRVPHIYDSYRQLLDDENVEIVDIAVPPDAQLEIVKYACSKEHVKGILCQKPLTMSLEEAKELVRVCREAGKPVAVNSNMRYDQSMRALKCVLDKGLLGEAVLGTIEMRAIPHWQKFLEKYDELEIWSMGIHHVDIFRYLFGDPEEVTAVCRTDPRTKFKHTDGIVQFTYKYANDLMATSLDDVWAWPEQDCEKDIYIKWRVEGTEGYAEGTIGWPNTPKHSPSRMRFTCKQYAGQWIEPTWNTEWFPDAFGGTMTSLMRAVESGERPEISAEDNLRTIGCVEACYKSIREKRTVRLDEIIK